MRNLLYVLVLGALTMSAQVSGPIVMTPTYTATTPTVESLARLQPPNLYQVSGQYTIRDHGMQKAAILPQAPIQPNLTVNASTPYRQTANFSPMGFGMSSNFAGLGLGTPGYAVNVAPPDTTLAVSPSEIVQWVNLHFAVYNKAGVPQLGGSGFLPGNALWQSLPPTSLCRQFNNGDPIVQYDRMADRWVFSQFAFNGNFSQNAQCFAVSQTSSAMGAFNLYEFSFGNVLPDYGKMGIWPDAYYMSFNMFTNGASFSGGRACAFDRAKMLAGLAATAICFQSPSFFSYLPADLDGPTAPPPGTPNYHISWNWYNVASNYTMQLTKFKVDFVTPANSTFTDGLGGGTFSFVGFTMGAATGAPCNDGGSGACVPQLGTGQLLDTLGDRHMYRLVYRNFGTHDALLITQSVDDNPGASTAQVRWIEVRNPGANPPVVYQNSTYTPDATYRWMSSAAFDKLGNIAIGYSVSSPSMNPGIRIAGRRRTDPLNLLRTEQTVQAGTGSQTSGLSRWGDYSTMQIDPINDCKFWYTTQYIAANGAFNWSTKIVGFTFPTCQ